MEFGIATATLKRWSIKGVLCNDCLRVKEKLEKDERKGEKEIKTS
jgi:hypothetical protein